MFGQSKMGGMSAQTEQWVRVEESCKSVLSLLIFRRGESALTEEGCISAWSEKSLSSL